MLRPDSWVSSAGVGLVGVIAGESGSPGRLLIAAWSGCGRGTRWTVP
ncbi:MAG: hypothetical protein M1134_06330 [Actinobacteria bacterium]|nr:hypothetical protein [Actinomycetota bacterium]MCL5445508.1 hypothetical protein [Actinomycetota bacterium]